MRVHKFLSTVSLLTFFSLLFVYQRTETLRLAYEGQKRQAAFEDLLDKNSILRYNVKKSASLVHLADKISGQENFHMPESYRLVRLTSGQENLRTAPAINRENILARLFGIKRQAEARTTNP